MSVLTKDKVQQFVDSASSLYNIPSWRAIEVLKAVCEMLEVGLLADYELTAILNDMAIGLDPTRSYSWPNKEGAFMLQCPLAYQAWVDLENHRGALQDCAKQERARLEKKNAPQDASSENE